MARVCPRPPRWEAALCLALVEDVDPGRPDRIELAKLCSRVENDWVGAETGLLDQLAVLCGEEGHAVRIDFARLSLEPVPLDLGEWQLVTVDSGASHEHAGGGYNERRAECRAACEALGVATLSEATPAAAEGLDDPLARRARHVLSENARVDAMVDALRAGELEQAGRLLDASHASLRDDYEASVPEVEATVERLKAAGAAGARMVGGGFGGAVLALFGPVPPRPEVPPLSRLARRLVVFDPASAAASGPTGATAPLTVRSSSSASSSSFESGRVRAHTRKMAATASMASPVHRFTLMPAARSMSASEAPRPRTVRITP
jgi:hypothetical protein